LSWLQIGYCFLIMFKRGESHNVAVGYPGRAREKRGSKGGDHFGIPYSLNQMEKGDPDSIPEGNAREKGCGVSLP